MAERIIGTAKASGLHVSAYQVEPGATVILRVETPFRVSYLDIEPEHLSGVLAALSEADLTVSREG